MTIQDSISNQQVEELAAEVRQLRSQLPKTGMPSQPFAQRYLSAEPRHLGVFIESGDHIGITFSIAAGIMLISTAFFFFQATKVPGHWRTSMFVIGCVTGTAFWHYQYLADLWVERKHVLPVYRYVDWFLTVPMQIIEFYLILKASTGAGSGLFWKLFLSSMVMLLGGYFGETQLVNQWMAFFVGTLAWLYIIYEIFTGECARLNDSADESVKRAFKSLRIIVTFGWALYPIGYVVGNATKSEAAEDALNGIYNIADLVNKTAFGLVLYIAATTDYKKEQFVKQDERQQEKSRQFAQEEMQRQMFEMQLTGGAMMPGAMTPNSAAPYQQRLFDMQRGQLQAPVKMSQVPQMPAKDMTTSQVLSMTPQQRAQHMQTKLQQNGGMSPLPQGNSRAQAMPQYMVDPNQMQMTMMDAEDVAIEGQHSLQGSDTITSSQQSMNLQASMSNRQLLGGGGGGSYVQQQVQVQQPRSMSPQDERFERVTGSRPMSRSLSFQNRPNIVAEDLEREQTAFEGTS